MIYDKNISHQKTTCFHCGDECTTNKKISIGEKYFCCNGCKTVYEILNENDLCEYYELNASPGIEQKNTIRKDKFEFLDNLEIKQKLIQFTDNKTTQVIFYLPQIHCSSCLWLLESINIVDKGIIKATVNFTKKELFITYNEADTSLRKVVETLTKIGYEPHLSLQDIDSKEANKTDRTRWYKIGVAGFCFANIMMVSIADYVSINNPVEYKIKIFFSLLCVVLSLPVLFYAANEFFIAAWNGIKNRPIPFGSNRTVAEMNCNQRFRDGTQDMRDMGLHKNEADINVMTVAKDKAFNDMNKSSATMDMSATTNVAPWGICSNKYCFCFLLRASTPFKTMGSTPTLWAMRTNA
jgi:hypothetical protein